MNRHALWLGAALACAGAMMSCLGDDTVGTSPAIDGGNDGTSRADGGPGDASIDVGPEETSGIDAGPADVALDVCCAPDEGHPPLGAPVFTPPPGIVYPGSNVALSFPSTVPPGASILYTNDGTVPDPSNPSSLVYAGPILINTSVTLLAVTIAAGYTRSNIAGGTYTPGNPCGVTPVVIFNTLSQTQSNDFLLSLSSAPSGKTICYTLDGSNATCTKGGCTGVSVTYDAVSQIPIDGMETNTQTGLVSVVAIACTPGFWSCPSSNLQEEQYTLAAAAPSIVNLSSGDGGTSSPDAGVSLVLDTATKSTASPANPVSIHYTTGGGPPSCTTGTSVTPPYTLSGLPSTTTVQAIACKTGYLPSSVTSWP